MAFIQGPSLSRATQKAPISYEIPDIDIKESGKNEEWYIQYLRYLGTFYNRRPPYFSTDYMGNDSKNILSPIEQGLRNSLYLLGKQQNIDYNYTTTDISGNSLQSVWIKGKKIQQLSNHLVGNLVNQLENKDIVTRNLSKDASNKKSRMLEDLMLKHDMQSLSVFQELDEMGIQFNPAGRRKFDSREAVEKFINFEWKDNFEEISTDTAIYCEEINRSNNMYIDCFFDYIAADYCAVHNFAEAGRVKQKRIPFYNLIWDSVSDDSFNGNMAFVGFLERLTLQEVFKRWPNLPQDDKDEMRQLAKNEGFRNTYIDKYNTSNINWYSYKESEMYISAMTMYWIGNRDTRYEEKISDSGIVKYVKVDKDADDPGQYVVEDWHKATILGNKWLKDWGYASNIVRTRKNRARPESPIKVFAGQSILGDHLSLVGTISDNQDRMDAFRHKIMELISKDAGKNYIINGHKLGSTVLGKEIIADFRSMGIHVTTGVSGEAEDSTDNKSMVETVDMSLDPNIKTYIELFAEEERIMEEAMNIPKIALGQQQTYIGLGTQRGTIAQSTLGLAKIYRGFNQFNEICLQHAVNIGKLIYTEPGSEAPFVIGDRGARFLKWIKDYRYEDILLFIKTKDIIDEQGKQRLLAIAQAMAQNQQIDIIDYLRIEMASSRTKLLNDLEFSVKKKKREEIAAQAATNQREEGMQEKDLENKASIAATKEIAQDGRTDKEVTERIVREGIKADAKNPTKDLPVVK